MTVTLAIRVQVGNSNVTVINRIMHAVKTLADEMPKFLKNVELKRLRVYPGTAQGEAHCRGHAPTAPHLLPRPRTHRTAPTAPHCTYSAGYNH